MTAMRVLFAWEMGKNYGHVTQIADVAAELASRGVEIYMALQSPAAMRPFAGKFDYHLLQAPYHPVRPPRKGEGRMMPQIYPDDLLPCGYANPDDLSAQVRCWRSLYDLVRPDALLTQAAPTALLAARGMKFKTAQLGRSYDVPPLDSPMPPLRYWEEPDKKNMQAREDAVLKNINEALESLKLSKLKRFRDMMETDMTFLCTIAELDHYPERKGVEYYGPFVKTDSGESYSWNKGAAKRILAYIRPNGAGFESCLKALASLPPDHDIIVAAPGIPEGVRKKLSRDNLGIIDGPVRLDKLLPDCDLAVSHGSAGICCALALAGVPMLMLPGHVEQLMFARAVGRTGAGRGLVGRYGGRDILKLMGVMLTDLQFRENAKALARKYASFSPADLAVRIADEIEAGCGIKSARRKKG